MTTPWPKLYKVVPNSSGPWWIETEQLYPNVKRVRKDFILIIIEEEGLERLTLVPRKKVPHYIPIPKKYQRHPFRRSLNERRLQHYRDRGLSAHYRGRGLLYGNFG